jgi:PhzF family phenazine biosynthesis protein
MTLIPRPFHQVDVFTAEPLLGNPLAVVADADGLSDAQMAAFARWTNLSETTFLLRPTTPEADYRVRIFTPTGELPFAGHPTLGSCFAWLAQGGRPRQDVVVQECGVGLVRVRRDGPRLAFAAPPLRRSGAVDAELHARLARALGLAPEDLLATEWVDNGAGWTGALLGSRAQVLALAPDFSAMGGLKIGVVAPWDPAVDGDEAQFEVRAFVAFEDPVTGSLNAGLAQWLIGSGRAPARYVASQGTALGRRGRVHIDKVDDGTVWVGGDVVSCIQGTVTI